ncbi:MAG: hypothetical protein HIU87_12440 [Acidobacteria bacterium]|nr:hypothetical protein [Acidobacteriota bacterium]
MPVSPFHPHPLVPAPARRLRAGVKFLLRPSPGSHGVRRDLKEGTVFERAVDSDAQTILAGDNQVERDNS